MTSEERAAKIAARRRAMMTSDNLVDVLLKQTAFQLMVAEGSADWARIEGRLTEDFDKDDPVLAAAIARLRQFAAQGQGGEDS